MDWRGLRRAAAGLALLLGLGAVATTSPVRSAHAAEPLADEDLPLSPDFEFDMDLPPLGDEASAPPAAQQTAPPFPPPTERGSEQPDPALDAPLPPLTTFDVSTPEKPVDVDTGEVRAGRLRYSYSVTGLDEVDLEDRFRALSALEEGDGEATNSVQVTARVEEDLKLIERLLRSEGYYEGKVDAVTTPAPGQPARIEVAITATPGERFRLDEIGIAGPATVPPGLARDALPIASGDRIDAARIEAAEANVSLRLPEQGYPFVEFGVRDILLDPAANLGDYTLPVEPGPKSSFGNIRTAGDAVFEPDHIQVLARFEPGEIYDSRLVDDLRRALVATNLFSTVAVEPVRTGDAGPARTERVDLLVRQQPGPQRRLAASAGYGTGEGLRIEGLWTHRNLFPPEGALTVRAVAGTQEQRLGVEFRRSNAGRRDRTVQALAEISREDRAAYNARSFTLSGRISRDSTPIWQKRWTHSFGAELIATDETRFVEATGDRTRNTFFIAALPAQIGFDTSDSLLDPTRGFRVTLRTSPEASLQSGAFGYVRNLAETSGYFPVSDALVMAGRVRLGAILGAGRNRIAPSRRLYAGGGGSVRGFGFQDLGPRDANDDPAGGRSLNEFSLETRYRFGDYGIVAFVDAGQVYRDDLPKFSKLRFGVGVGGRLYTNFGPLRVDVATPIDRRPGEPRVALYISIGQAF